MSESERKENDIDAIATEEAHPLPEETPKQTEEVSESNETGKPKKSWTRRLLKTLMWLVLTPILLLLLLIVLLYLPPVQRWAVDRASAWLSEEMKMDVTVEHVRLSFPLDLEMGGMLAIQEGDTVLDAKSLEMSIQLLPLFSGKVEVDKVCLEETKLNTRGIVESMQVKGNVGLLTLESHNIDLSTSVMHINHLNLRDADLFLAMADSVPEDTTVSEPSTWKIVLDDVVAERVKFGLLLSPQADSTRVGLDLGYATLKGELNLAKELFTFQDINLKQSGLSFDGSGGQPSEGFDAGHIAFSDLHVKIPTVTYNTATGDMLVKIDEFAGQERSGLQLTRGAGEIVMDSVSLNVKRFDFATPSSTMELAYRMDMTAFDTPTPETPKVSPGQFSLVTKGQVGKSDLMLFGASEIPNFWEAWPQKQLAMDMDVAGNLHFMRINHLNMALPNAFDISATGQIQDPTESWGMMGVDLTTNARLKDIEFVKNFLPAETRQSFMIPKNMYADAEVSLWGKNASLDMDLTLADGTGVDVMAGYGLADGSWGADVEAYSLDVGRFVPMDEAVNLTGTLHAKGRGFDFFSPATTLEADVALENAQMGQLDLSGCTASLQLNQGVFTCDATADNNLLKTHFLFDGKVQQNWLDGTMDIDLAHADFKALGFTDEVLTLRTNGKMTVQTDYAHTFRINADVQEFDMLMGEDHITTQQFNLVAETAKDTTSAVLSTGDLYFDFNAPENLFTLLDKTDKFATLAATHFKDRTLTVDGLRAYMPTMRVRTQSGQNNPLAQILALNGLRYGEMKADFSLSPDAGVVGQAHLYSLQTDSMLIDSLVLHLKQESDRYAYEARAFWRDQKAMPGYTVNVDGYLADRTADAHVLLFNSVQRKALDLGLNAEIADSMLNVRLYPEQPVLAFRTYTINPDNYIRLAKKNKMYADVRLTSVNDSSSISIFANPDASMRQDVRAVVQNLDLSSLRELLPDLPKMDGLLTVDANYLQDSENFWVKGMSKVDQFVYDGTSVGNAKAVFDYAPKGEYLHDVTARLYHNDLEVALVSGMYNSEGKGYLDADLKLQDLPLSMTAPFIPDQIVMMDGTLGGNLRVQGPLDAFIVNGQLLPNGMKARSDVYSLNLTFADEPFNVENSRISFDRYKIYGPGEEPLTLNGWVDFANLDLIELSLSLYGKNFQLIDAPRTRKSMVFGKMYGDFFARVTGDSNNLSIRGLVKVLSSTNMTYVMADTPLSMDYRLDDIVTFIDFTAPPELDEERVKRTFMGVDMQLTLTVEDGALFSCEFSADRQSYVNVQGGGSIIMTQTPEGVFSMTGRYTVNEGQMKYVMPIIPLKTFEIEKGSYVEFTGEPGNPTINVSAAEETKATVTNSDGTSRSVTFDAGLKVKGTLDEMQLEFTIDAPEDISVKNELASLSKEERNKLAVGLLCTGMYLSSSNSSGFSANNALNNFLQSEINNIAGKALATTVDVNVEMEQNARLDGSTRTDYAFKFSKRFFSNRLNVIIGGKVNTGNTPSNESGTYIDNVSLEYRLDNGGTRYIRLYHEKNYDNLIEGELIENGASIVLRKKFDKLSDIIIWHKKEDRENNQKREVNDQKKEVNDQTKEENNQTKE